MVHETLSQEYPTQKRAGGVVQVVEYLRSKGEALNSNPSATKKKKKIIWQKPTTNICTKNTVNKPTWNSKKCSRNPRKEGKRK
jgi:hypothetical protein